MTAQENATWWAMMLARDVDACASLLRGEPVDPSRLDAGWVEYAKTFELIRLDVHANDLLHNRAALRDLIRTAA